MSEQSERAPVDVLPGPSCASCGGPVEAVRWCYVSPTCYACMPPPVPLPVLGPLPPADPSPVCRICRSMGHETRDHGAPRGYDGVGAAEHERVVAERDAWRRLALAWERADRAEAEPLCGGVSGAWEEKRYAQEALRALGIDPATGERSGGT